MNLACSRDGKVATSPGTGWEKESMIKAAPKRATKGLAGHGQALAFYSKSNQKLLHCLRMGTIII